MEGFWGKTFIQADFVRAIHPHIAFHGSLHDLTFLTPPVPGSGSSVCVHSSPLPRLRRDLPHSGHICAGTRLTRCHLYAGTGLICAACRS